MVTRRRRNLRNHFLVERYTIGTEIPEERSTRMTTDLALSAADFEKEVLNSEIPVLLDFWAEWCGPCKAIGPAVEELAAEYAGRAKVYKVNVDEEGDLAMRFGIMSIPSLLIFKGGQKVDQMIGAAPKAKLAEFLAKHV